MYHSLIFVDGAVTRHTWDNWHLIPSSRPVISRPSPAYKMVDIPGMDGQLDLTDYLIGRPTYSNCSGTFQFYVANEKVYGDWASRKSEISGFLNGRKMRMFLEDDPQYYYEGRFYLSGWNPGAAFSTVSIDYQVLPYKFLSFSGEKVWA